MGLPGWALGGGRQRVCPTVIHPPSVALLTPESWECGAATRAPERLSSFGVHLWEDVDFHLTCHLDSLLFRKWLVGKWRLHEALATPGRLWHSPEGRSLALCHAFLFNKYLQGTVRYLGLALPAGDIY